jgi:hypothetical protein
MKRITIFLFAMLFAATAVGIGAFNQKPAVAEQALNAAVVAGNGSHSWESCTCSTPAASVVAVVAT